MSFKSILIKFFIATVMWLFVAGQVTANSLTLSCRLYNASSTAEETLTKVDLENSAQTLDATRIASFCIFDDGTVAEKQFVNVSRTTDNGATGMVLGISVYTMENGDSITATFTGDWGSQGFVGRYQIFDGTGMFSDAKGYGSFTGAKSPWSTSQVFDVVLNVTTQ